MPLVRILKKTVGLLAYVVASDSLESPADKDAATAPEARLARAATWLRWVAGSETLPVEDPPADARPATRGIWFLGSDPFPSDLPEPEKKVGFWSWLLGSERGE